MAQITQQNSITVLTILLTLLTVLPLIVWDNS